MSPRPYRLGKRAESAAETRARIVEAARALFEATGFHKVSVEAVAAQAGVGRTTVFEQFGSKRKLLQAVEAEVSRRAGAEAWPPPPAAHARDSLQAALRSVCQVWAREHAMFRKLLGLALIDTEMARVLEEKRTQRRQAMGVLAHQLAEQGCLRPGESEARAADVLWLLTSFETFSQLYERGLDCGAVADTLERLASSVLASA
jgi:AcrR family transcriptional regulator